MNEDNNKDIKTSEENKTDESQIEEINEKDEDSSLVIFPITFLFVKKYMAGIIKLWKLKKLK